MHASARGTFSDQIRGIVSRHPDNPFWHQQNDQAIVIYRQDWDEAVAGGYVTTEHILIRLAGMMENALGPQEVDFVAYDEDGFIVALTAEGIWKDGIQIRVNPDDHDPPHAHIIVPGEKMKLTINLLDMTIDQDLPDGWSKKGKSIEAFTRKNQYKLLGWWAKNNPPT